MRECKNNHFRLNWKEESSHESVKYSVENILNGIFDIRQLSITNPLDKDTNLPVLVIDRHNFYATKN